MRSSDEATLLERNKKLSTAFAKIDKALAERKQPYFNGPAIGLVDIAWLPLLHRAHIIEEATGFDQFNSFQHAKRWQQQLLNSGLYEKSVADDFIQKFSNFYLSEKTHLGRKAKGINNNCHSGENLDTACSSGKCC